MSNSHLFSEALGRYFQYYQDLKYRQAMTWLALISCVVALGMIIEGLSGTQKFALSRAHDLLIDPATIDPSLGINRLSSYPPLEQILLYIDGVKYQVWIAVGLLVRLCGLLLKTRLGMALAALGLLFSAYKMWKYIAWSFGLLYCDSCSQNVFMVSASGILGSLCLIIILIMIIFEIALLIKFLVRHHKSQRVA